MAAWSQTYPNNYVRDHAAVTKIANGTFQYYTVMAAL